MIGTRLEHYEITAHLGSGGMGDVYQATDTKLGRGVAIKVLPDTFARDADRAARFEREARVLASLNHPHIAAIYGLERSAAHPFLVMELVPGDTLADRISRAGPRKGLPVGEALSVARQIGEALAVAHQNGIVHRDLKPANIKVTPDGTVKVLDFGLAKVTATAESGAVLSHSPTITNPAMTEAGVILGTAAYMSPEQAKGRPVDKRSDVWSFGCVLFEMLTGVRLFEGPDVSETLAAVLTREPDWSLLPAAVPPPVARLLRQCLERDRAKRMTDIAGALFALDEVQHAGPTSRDASSRGARRLAITGWSMAVLAAAAAFILWVKRPALPDAPTVRLEAVIPGDEGYSFAISPTGQSLAVSATVDKKSQLWLRRIDTGELRPLVGTEGAFLPFWSRDGAAVGFFAGGALKRIDLDRGYVRTIAPIRGTPRRGSWNQSGTMLYATATGPIYKVSAESGGTPTPITTLLAAQSSHRYPTFLPDGRHFLFLALGDATVKGVYLAALDDSHVTRVVGGEPPFSFVAPNILLLGRDGALWAQRFSLDTGRPEGDALPVVPRLLTNASWNGLGALSASASGSIALRSASSQRQLFWLDRDGRVIGSLGETDDAQLSPVTFSTDGKTLVISRSVGGNTDLWLMGTARGEMHRATTGAAIDGNAVFSPDGTRMAYSSDPGGQLWDVYERQVDGAPTETLLVANPGNDYAGDWSPDGKYILLTNDTQGGNISALPRPGGGKPFLVAQTSVLTSSERFSPDGRWIAFTSSETGRDEIYAQPFPGPGPRIQLTVAGAGPLAWPRKSWEMFYAVGDRVMALPIDHRGSTLVPGTPHALWTLRDGDVYLPTPDGQRFVVSRIVAPPPPLSVILNWKPPQGATK